MTRLRHHRPASSASNGRRRDRGAVLVEAAFVFPILVLFVFGIIEWGAAYNNVSVAGSASRTGARLASHGYAPASNRSTFAASLGDAMERDLQGLDNAVPTEAWIYRATSTTKPSSCSSSTRCYRLTWNATTEQFNTPSGGWTDPVACGSNLDEIGVMVRFRHDFFTQIFGASRTFDQRTIMRLEPLSTDVC